MLLDFSQYKYPEQYCKPTTAFDNDILYFLKKWRTQNSFTVTTSGSTGAPKSIVHGKETMLKSAQLTGAYFNFQEGQTALLCLPIDKISGMMMLVRAIHWRLKLYTLPPKRKLDFSNLTSIDFAPLLPIQAIENFSQLTHIKTILLGGAKLPEQLTQKLQELSTSVYLSYGMTETLSHVALQKINGEKSTLLFTALSGITFTTDECSRLCITAPQLSIKKLKTNDIVKLHSATSFEFLGRYDNVINSGGLKILAENIEQQLSPFISLPFYIYGVPDSTLGEKVTLCIQGKKWDKTALDNLKENFKCINPKQAIPRQIIFKEKFAYTATGKIKK